MSWSEKANRSQTLNFTNINSMQIEANKMSSGGGENLTSPVLTECPEYCFVQDTTHRVKLNLTDCLGQSIKPSFTKCVGERPSVAAAGGRAGTSCPETLRSTWSSTGSCGLPPCAPEHCHWLTNKAKPKVSNQNTPFKPSSPHPSH